MGSSLGKFMARNFGKKELRILMLGLDAAGKTTILYKLKVDHPINTIPTGTKIKSAHLNVTVGFNVETIRFRNIRFNVWDVGGQEKIRPLWRHYYTGTQVLIFVVDSQDKDRIEEARLELFKIANDREMKNVHLLIFANKQDLPNAMSIHEITERLALERIAQDRKWFVQPSCATTGEGLQEGLTWISTAVKPK